MRCVTMISAVLSWPLHHGVTEVCHDRKYRQEVQTRTHTNKFLSLRQKYWSRVSITSLRWILCRCLHSSLYIQERVQVPLCGWKLSLQVKQARHIPQMGVVVKPGVPSAAQLRGLMLYFDWIVSHIESSHHFERQVTSRQDKHQNRPPKST